MFGSLGGLLGAKGEHGRGHLPVVIRLVELKRRTFRKTKLRELSFWTLVSLHRCNTFQFLEFNDDIGNHSRTVTTATFLRKRRHRQSQHKFTLKKMKTRLRVVSSENCICLRIFPFDCKYFRASTSRRVFKSKNVCSNRFKAYSDVMKGL